MEKWLRERLSICLDFEIPDDMIKYILSMKDSKEFDEYFETLLNKDSDDHRLFLADCKQRLFNKTLPNKKQPITNPLLPKKGSYGSGKIKQNISGKVEKQPKTNNTEGQQQGAKKKSKFVSLYNNDGKVDGGVIMLKGRRLCDCQATEHKLINNCLTCGRVVCEQEGSGPCIYCGEIVCTNEEQAVLKTSNKKSDELLKSLKNKGGGEALKKALEQRDRLLEYDRNSEKRTVVIDDELDYFQENSVWLSDAEREKFARLKQEMHEKKHESRAQRKITVDFAGRAVKDDSVISAEYEQQVLKEVAAIGAAEADSSNWSNRSHDDNNSSAICNVDPNIETERPIYIEKTIQDNASKPLARDGLERSYNRVQDKELLEMQDMRQCLSMHQPWASLLVEGIKKHEGRVWYSEHRGRLWIASTAKEPRTEEIQEMENFYKKFYNDPSMKFPEDYPTSCLLGRVKLEDCLPQEEYRENHPEGESESPYVFICNNAEKLPVVFPIKGQHKIYQIDPKIHNTACKMLLRMKTSNG